MNITKIDNKEKITSLELLEQINLFRAQENNKTELRHDTLLGIIRDEFEEEISLQKILESTYKNDRGREYPMFVLSLAQGKQVLVRESKFVRKAVIQYIEKLEAKKTNIPQTYAEALLEAGKLALENEKLMLELKENTPRINFAKTIEIAAEGILVREFSKVLANEGIKIGEKNLYKWLREAGYICKTSTEPTQRAVEKGLFVVNERVISTVKGNIPRLTSKITGKGQIYFLEKIKEDISKVV